MLETTEDERFEILYVYDRAAGKKGNAVFVRDRTRASLQFPPLVPDITDDSFHVDRQRRRPAPCPHRQRRARTAASSASIRRDPAEANWKTCRGRETRAARAGIDGRRQVVRDLHEGRHGTRARARPGRSLRSRGRRCPGPAPSRDSAASVTRRSSSSPSRHSPSHRRLYRYDIAARTSTVFRASELPGFDASAYETKQVFVTSKDGTRVPMFLVHRKGIVARRHETRADVRLRRLQRRRRRQSSTRCGWRCSSRAFIYASVNMRGRRRIRRSVARRRNEDEKAERVRRLHRRRRVADCRELHHAGAAWR